MQLLGYKKKETANNESLEQNVVIIIKVSFNLKKKKLRDCRKKPCIRRFSNQLYTINTCL